MNQAACAQVRPRARAPCRIMTMARRAPKKGRLDALHALALQKKKRMSFSYVLGDGGPVRRTSAVTSRGQTRRCPLPASAPARGAPLHRQVERILDNRKLAPELARAFERGGIPRPAPANDPAPARGNTADTQPPL